ncbi:hypothetical protein [Micromonospora sp. NPDC023814]|uniref:hypothetical protein n=1 Tax=Micromonospora sp. NPDC023814 TaxID=3154596 RepID=UPI0033D55776
MVPPDVARRPDEEHRATTPLELFFDLCFVVAVTVVDRRRAIRTGRGEPAPGPP